MTLAITWLISKSSLKGVAPEGFTMAHIYKGILLFVLLQIVGIIILVFVPELVTWLPGNWTKKGATE
jgi:TRAP-type mannitol/chloroaromatic compound transport system permease large subunit